LAYWLEIPDSEQAYLDGLPLFDSAKERIREFIGYALADVDDAFRLDPANRTHPDTRYFLRQLLLWDVSGDRRVHRLDFYVNDENADQGVLILVYVDCQ
jgi:hypothetical protein